MTTILFIRHGAHDLLGKTLAGRTREVHLNELGKHQAAWASDRVLKFKISAIFSSPLIRCIETANVIAERLHLSVQQTDLLNEVDFGEWSGNDFVELAPVAEWQEFNALRSILSAPGGESLVSVQARISQMIEALYRDYPNRCVAVVSHADVIKTSLAYALGIPLDLFHRIEISPCSLSVVAIEKAGPRILLMNETLPN